MRKNILLFAVAMISLLAQADVQTDVHRCGTYNIRTWASGDTGTYAWSYRRQYVVSMIRDTLKYDVVGLQEVTPTQYSYLEGQLKSVYSFVNINNKNSSNQLLYRTSRYNCLNKGSFYLAPDITKSGHAWDAEFDRFVVWAKLQDKTSGEIMVFAVTHLDLHPISIREGARVATEQMVQICGDYPCIIVGDMNCEPFEHDPHSNFNAYFGNARTLSKTAPKGSYGTYIPSRDSVVVDTKLIDYLYVRNTEVESYYACPSTMPGTTDIPSDHMPVMCELKLLPSQRAFFHSVNTVEELREVCKSIQPNDIVYLNDGQYDLADSSLYVANTCVIEGSEKAVLTGSAQLFTLPDMISMGWKNLVIRAARFAQPEQGSIITIKGKYFNMYDCTLEDCSTEGDGLICSLDCATTIDGCVFRNNEGLKKNGGLQIMSNVGVDRYPFTLRHCLFEHNTSVFASALYYTGDATAYIYGNSFVENIGWEKGALVFFARSNVKDIRLVNNTIVNNRIDVESSFMDNAVGGSAIWEELSDSGRLTLMNNTIVGNYTACWVSAGVSSTSFPSGAICSQLGEMALYNNIIAGNYSSKPGCGDVSIVDPYTIRKLARNVLSSSDNMQIMKGVTNLVATDYAAACQQMIQLFEGSVDSLGAYTATLQYYGPKRLPALAPYGTMYAGQNMAMLDVNAMSAAMIGSDIMNVGTPVGILTVDQMGEERNMPSVPGSMEALPTPMGLEMQNAECTMQSEKRLVNGQIVIVKNGVLYNLLGNRL